MYIITMNGLKLNFQQIVCVKISTTLDAILTHFW